MTRNSEKKQSGNTEQRISTSLFGGTGNNENLEELRQRQVANMARRNKVFWAFVLPVVVIAAVVLVVGVRAQRRQAALNAQPPPPPQEARPAAPVSEAEVAEAVKKGGWKAQYEGNCTSGKLQIEVIEADEDSMMSHPLVAPFERAVDVKPSHVGLTRRCWRNQPGRDSNAQMPPRQMSINGKKCLSYHQDGKDITVDLTDENLKATQLYALLNALHAAAYPEDACPLQIKEPALPPQPAQKPEKLKLGMPEGFSKD